MQRREFITLAGGVAAAWPFAARAQQADRGRRVVVLQAAGGAPQEVRYAAFREALRQLGWTDGSNLRIERRVAGDNADRMREYTAELAALSPDVILAAGGSVERLLRATRTVPIVFVVVPDPVGSGLVARLSRPGGNATGFMQFEYSLCAKWLELLKEIAPGVRQAAVLRDPAVTAGVGQFAVIQSVAPSLRVEVSPINLDNASEIERAVTAFAGSPNGGLILTAGSLGAIHRDLIIALAARHKLPAVYSNPIHAAAGGLACYGADFIDQYRLAAGYVDRILKGEKPADLPVQAPTRYKLVLNLKTAAALGLTVPQALLARADEVIE
jgi:putative ABC transport system substrate-binding protein